MPAVAKEELFLVAQALLALFISYVFVRFLAVFAFNYQILAGFGVVLGIALIYFSFRKNKDFDTFMGLTALFAIPMAVMFYFLPL